MADALRHRYEQRREAFSLPGICSCCLQLELVKVGNGPMARYNMSKDPYYFPKDARKLDRRMMGHKLHAVPPLSMLTMPFGLPTATTAFHRPRSAFAPAKKTSQIMQKREGTSLD